MNSCPVCEKGKRHPVDDITYEFGKKQVEIPGERCTHCKEEFFNAEYLDIIQNMRKQYEKEKLRLRRKLSRSGRGTVLRIPTDIEKHFKIKGTENVTICVDGKKRFVVEIE